MTAHRVPEAPARTGHVIATMCVALAAVVSAVSSLNVALPDLAKATGATQTELQWVVDAYALVFAGLLLSAGALGDRIGRRGVLVGGLVVFALAAGVASLTDSPSALIAARAVMGVGAAAIMPQTLSIITAEVPQDHRERAVAIWAGVAGGSALLGLLVAGALLEVTTWEAVFGFNALLAVVALIATVRWIPPSHNPDRPALDPVGGLLSAAGVAGIVFGVIEGPAHGWLSLLTVASVVGGVVLLVLFVLWELRHDDPLLDPRLFRLAGFSAGSVSLTVQFFAFFGFVFVVLQYLQLVLGYSPLEAGAALAPMAMAVVGVSRRSPVLVARLGARRVAPAGLVVMAIGFAVLSRLGTDSSYWLVLAGVLPLGIGMGLATTPATSAIVDAVPKAKQGVASAVNDVSREIGGALGIAVLGSVLTSRYTSGVADATARLPAAAADRADDALPAALAIAGRLGRAGEGLADVARASFVDGLSAAMLVAAGALAVVAVWVAVRVPSAVGAGETGTADHGGPATDDASDVDGAVGAPATDDGRGHEGADRDGALVGAQGRRGDRS